MYYFTSPPRAKSRLLRGILLSLFLFALLLSCEGFADLFSVDNSDSDSGDEGREIMSFFARDYENRDYSIKAAKLVEGDYCVIWRETGRRVDMSIAESIAREFDRIIFPKITAIFGESANYTLSSDNKLTILLLDIKDDYKKGTNDSYVAGYFLASDLPGVGSGKDSNNRIMIHMDIDPGTPGTHTGDPNFKAFCSTIAHEFTHFLSFTIGRESGRADLDVWIDEGLASAAEYIYAGHHITTKVNYFSDVHRYYLQRGQFYEDSRIVQGENFYVWPYTSDYLWDKYVTVYLFFQWLGIQGGRNAIYRDIITSPNANYRAVTGAAAKNIGAQFAEWNTLLETWLLANRINAKTGIYGYKGELELTVAGISESTMSLNPGEGVYSVFYGSRFSVPSNSGSIRYQGVTEEGTLFSQLASSYLSSWLEGSWLLTYNGNYNAYGMRETGTLTGLGDPQTGGSAGQGTRSALPDSFRGPFPIGLPKRYTSD